MKKSFLLGLLFGIFSYAKIFAQNFDEARLETMTNEFIQRAESSDALSLMTNIKSYYSSLSIDDKRKMLSYVTNKTSGLLENEKKDDALAVIYLYQNLVDNKDEKLPTLLFIKGNIYADKVDSIHLKRTIDELNSGVLKSNKDAARYIEELDKRLIDLRNYIPSYKKLEGEWVINRMVWDKTETGNHSIVNPTLIPIFLFPCCHRRSSVLDYFTVYYKLLFFSRKAFSCIPASRRCPQPPSSACCTA